MRHEREKQSVLRTKRFRRVRNGMSHGIAHSRPGDRLKSTSSLLLAVVSELQAYNLLGLNRLFKRSPEKRSAPRAGQRRVGAVASRSRPLARSLRGRDRRC